MLSRKLYPFFNFKDNICSLSIFRKVILQEEERSFAAPGTMEIWKCIEPSFDLREHDYCMPRVRKRNREMSVSKVRGVGKERLHCAANLGGTLLYKLVPSHRIGFLRRFGLKTGIHFAHFGLESGLVVEGTTGVYERIYRFNSKLVRKKREM